MNAVTGWDSKVTFIWSVADLLRGDVKAHEYGQIILPFTVLRQLECALAPTGAGRCPPNRPPLPQPPQTRDQRQRPRTTAVGLPGAVAWIIAALASAGFCAVMYQAKKKQFAKVWGTSTLTLSPIGADMRDGNTRVQMSWSQVERIGDASIMGPLRFGGFTDVAKAVGALSAASMKRKEMALLGTARLTVNPDAPAMVKTQVK